MVNGATLFTECDEKLEMIHGVLQVQTQCQESGVPLIKGLRKHNFAMSEEIETLLSERERFRADVLEEAAEAIEGESLYFAEMVRALKGKRWPT